MPPYRCLATAAAAVALMLTGCTDAASDTSENRPTSVQLYGSDGIMQDELGAGLEDPTVLAGLKGTAPMNQLPTEFTNRLLEIDSSVGGFLYAGETYDAVVISALAAELAGTPDPAVVRDYVNSVTTGGERCTTVAACLELARDGEQLEYRGVSLRGGFTDRGEPAAASYATLHFGSGGVIDQAKTEFVGAGDRAATTEAEPPEAGPRPDGPAFEIEPLRLGGLLPQSGALEFAYPPMAAAAELAIEEINDAGGVFGVEVEWLPGDDGSLDADVALATLADHLEEQVHILIGPAASDTTEAVLPAAVAAGRIVFSPSSTRADLSAGDHDGFFFRTAPPDVLQGAALADVVLRDGGRRIVIVAQNGVYGRGLQANLSESLQRFGITEGDLTLLNYEPPDGAGELAGSELAGMVERIAAAQPDAVVLIGFLESARVVQAMIDAGLPLRT